MRELVECLQDWLGKNRADGNAYQLVAALAGETLKRADSGDPGQREFDAEALSAAAAGPGDFEPAKRWIDRAKPEVFVSARQASIEQHFRAAGHSQALRVARRSPRGKHRAVWFLESYALPNPADDPESKEAATLEREPFEPLSIRYEFTPPGQVKAAWYARPLIGAGSFVTRSWRGLLWVAVFLVPLAYLLVAAMATLGFTYLRRPIQTSDLATMLVLVTLGWAVWRIFLRPMHWLLGDRITLASELWVSWREETAQLELATDKYGTRRLQLVRYSAVCPICASTIELRYSHGPNRRRLVGACNEVPIEHAFTFDRILRTGRRMEFR